MIGLRHAPPTDMLSLAHRRHEIRRRRHGLAHGIGWGAATLVAAWLLVSAVFGFANL